MSPLTRGPRVMRPMVEGLALMWMVIGIVVVGWRWMFPLELEWMEGGLLHQALRMQQGLSPYPPPGPDFVPFLYTPLYAAVVAIVGGIVPLGFAVGRAVSIGAWVAILVALWQAVRYEAKPRAHAAVAVGLGWAGYVFTFRWIDLARPDTLYMALVLWGLVLLRRSEGRTWRVIVAGVLMGLAFWTKQTAALFIIASGGGMLLFDRRRWPLYVGVIAVIDGGGVLVGNALTDGWMWTYIYELHQSHAFNHERFTTKTWGMFAHAWPAVVVMVVGLVAAGVSRRVRGGGPGRSGGGMAYWSLMAGAGLLASALGYATQWAEPNAFIPGVVMGAVAVAVALPTHGRGETVALGLVAAQLVFSLVVEPMYHPVQTQGFAGLRSSYQWQDPWRTVPRLEQWRQAQRLRSELSAVLGEVLALHRPWWSVIAGGDGHVGTMGLTDLSPAQRRAIQAALRERVRAQRYAQIWIEGEPPRWLLRDLRRMYRLESRRRGAQRVRPLSGYMSEAGMVTPYVRDQLLFVPRTP